MEKTTNYEQFKKLDYNRKVSENHVSYLMKIIQIKNRLEYFPIIVTQDLEVVDGQHRLEAAKRLRIPIYYEIKKNYEPQDVYTINIAQKKWSREDILNYYQAQGETSYILISEFMRKNNINFNTSVIFLSCGKGGEEGSSFREGKIKITIEDVAEAQEHYDKFIKFADYVSEKSIGARKYLQSPTLKHAFVAFCNMKGFNFDLFMKKLPYGLHLLRPSGIRLEYLKMLIQIYNWKNPNHRLEFPNSIAEITE